MKSSKILLLLCPLLATGSVLATSATPWDMLSNLSYPGIYPQPVKLTQGVYLGKPAGKGAASRPKVELNPLYLLLPAASNDKTTAVTLLSESAGGSGTHLYLALVAKEGKAWKAISSVLLGDRLQVRSLKAEGDKIVLEVIASGPEEPACCPTQRTLRTFAITGNQFVESASQVLGTLSAKDLEGVKWKLTHLDTNQPVPANVTVTAEFKDGKLAGSGGCNRYFASVVKPEPANFSLSQPGSTMMACPEEQMEVEAAFFKRLATVKGFHFSFGKLALTYTQGRTQGVLLFGTESLVQTP